MISRLMDYVGDIYIALRGIAAELELWNTRPRTGTIYLNGVESDPMTDSPISIPTDNVACRVDWKDRLGANVEHSSTDTSWTVVDENDQPTTVVSVEPDNSDEEEETGVCTFNAPQGQFRLVATTAGADGPVEAKSALYQIVAGAPAVGEITVG